MTHRAIEPDLLHIFFLRLIALGLCWLWLAGLGPLCQIARGQVTNSPTELTPIATEHLHNVWQLSARVFSGSEPEDLAAFKELVRLEIKTIVSVDGIAPRTDLAKQLGMRYVHVPIGYDGIEPETALSLTRVARDITGKIYVHCHHGRHRGPAAAAIVCRADDGRPAEVARLILEKAGTGKEYPGLWRDVEHYRRPASSVRLPELVERAEVLSLAAAMAKIDRTFDRLKLLSANQWQAPADHGDLVALDEAVQLRELFSESVRVCQTELRDALQAAQKQTQSLESSLRANEPANATRLLMDLSNSCKECHTRYRN